MTEETKQVPAAPGTFTPAKWVDKFRTIAEAQRKAEKTAGQFFSIRAGVLAFGGQPIPGGTMDTVVLESMHERAYYSKPFDADNPSSPDCYSFSMDGTNMVPHPEAQAPQAKDCASCQWDKFKSANNGKGKACREMRRLALLSADDTTDVESVANGSVGYLRVPVTSVKGFSSYVQGVTAATDLPLFCAVTRISVVPDSKVQVRVNFSRSSMLADDAVIDAVYGRSIAEVEAIQFPYPKPEDSASPETQSKPTKTRKF